MKSPRLLLSTSILILTLAGLMVGQQQTGSATVPQLVSYSGKTTDAQGKVISGIAGVTFAIYNQQEGGAPLWSETQNVSADSKGNFTVQLGAATANGLPLDLFSSGEARWLGVRINGGDEQPRVLLLSVPYALKAADAQTLGGLPPSAFVLAAPPSGGSSVNVIGNPTGNASAPDALGGSGTLDYVPLWTPDGNTLGNSVLYQSGTGSTARIGINTTTPASTLDIKGGATVRGALTLSSNGTATAGAGKNSQPEKLQASAYNSGTKAPVGQTFQWQAEPTGNNSSTPSGTLNLLFGSGSSTPAETGLNIASTGIITFAPGQTFPGSGGTITGVTAGTDLTGGGTSGTVTLNLDTTKVPLLNAANTFTGNQTVNGNLTATGVASASSYQIGSNLFAFGSYANGNAFLGFSGNSTSNNSQLFNTAMGVNALHSNTTGYTNTASGYAALFSNTTGYYNVATGIEALYSNTTGGNNTASGDTALYANTSGSDNTAFGASALFSNNASGNTAVGFLALQANTTGPDNTGIGLGALENNQAGSDNTASGYQALLHNTGSQNTATGSNALYSNSIGEYNTAIGTYVLYANTEGDFNTGTGSGALQANTTGSDNTADGEGALDSNTTGSYNTALGDAALYSNTTGQNNTAVGTGALFSNTGSTNIYLASSNTAVGTNALVYNTTGYENTAVGVSALNSNTTGYDLTCIGYNACTTGDALSNATAIGAHATVSQSNALVLGGTGEWAVKVGIGTETPTNVLTIARGAGHPVSDSWETYSSRRWKTNIKTLPDALAKVERLRGVSYDLKDSGRHEIGVIAEEVGAVIPEVVTYEPNGKDARGVDYSRLTALLIEAVKQQQRQIETQQAQVASQRQQIAVQRQQIRELRSEGQLLEGRLAQLEGIVDQTRRVNRSHVASKTPSLVARSQH